MGITGVCKALIPRWTFDNSSQKCEEFSYGGCGGNENNFESKEECDKTCGTDTSSNTGDCKAPKGVTGPCEATSVMWTYDQSTKKCEMFIYGGCEGNGNRFNSKAECENKCNASSGPGTDHGELCPSTQPVPGSACSNSTWCNYGQECCCGECSHSVVYGCWLGKWTLAHNTDFCRGKICEEEEQGPKWAMRSKKTKQLNIEGPKQKYDSDSDTANDICKTGDPTSLLYPISCVLAPAYKPNP